MGSVKRKDGAASATVPELKTAIMKLKHQTWTYMVTGTHQFPANISQVTFDGMGDSLKYINFMADIKALDDTTAEYLKKRGAKVVATTPQRHAFCKEALTYRDDTRLPGATPALPKTPFPKPTAYNGEDATADYHMCICAFKTSNPVEDVTVPDIKTTRCKRNVDRIQTDSATGVDFDNTFLQKGIAMLYDANLVVNYLKMRVQHVQETALAADNMDYASNRFALKKLNEPLSRISTSLNNDYKRLVDFLRNTSGPSADSQVGYKVGERQLDDTYLKEYSVTN